MQSYSSYLETASADYTIALVGNPNVGKSTIFNQLTGLKQHTGNWPGKTVTFAKGHYMYENQSYTLIDLPGIYSLATHSKEEEVTRDFICFKQPDAVIVVCDATCLERNLNLALQILELTKHVILCVNLIDEAHKKKIHIDTTHLARLLGIPVIPVCAKSSTGLEQLLLEVMRLTHFKTHLSTYKSTFNPILEEACLPLIEFLQTIPCSCACPHFFALKLLQNEEIFLSYVKQYCDLNPNTSLSFLEALQKSHNILSNHRIDATCLQDLIVTHYIQQAEWIARQVITPKDASMDQQDRKIDRLFIGKYTRFPIMALLLAFILWLTIVGANYPSDLLFNLFSRLETFLSSLLLNLGIPSTLISLLIEGVYRILTWVVAVMLPPMAIFFPLFTLLEDVGYLPRIAFNLDHCFKQCHACGKQALTMCMGLGCNAVGIEGCRIIDSPRERLIALLTNSLMPCNGRFPTLILLINMFFITNFFYVPSSLIATLLLLLAILLSIFLTFFTSWLLSQTFLKGLPSSFTLELPPYRKPQIIQTLIRSLLDRTLYVLRRSVCVAAPAGLVIWLLAHITLGEHTLLYEMTDFLDPFARLFGLNGIILTAFILGIPANEIIFPIIMMIYMSSNTIMPLLQSHEIKMILLNSDWTPVTALCTLIFLLFHWPCSTTLLTIYKETKSIKWTTIAFLIPTLLGFFLCFVVTQITSFF
ncbi:MAG: ferrous iron transport protein B [Cellulosilyticum sp.]|nr:ferrous iron transport protein B [Cellulosilyticum sp.]